MRVFGFNLSLTREKALAPVRSSSVLGTILEPFTGAWQKNITADRKEQLVAFSAVYACVSLIAEDIAKLRPRIMERTEKGIWEEVKRNTPFALVLRKPNEYQTRVQFFITWLVMKLLYGNAYILKERRNGVVMRMYVLDSRMVTPLVADDGSVFYQLTQDKLSGLVNSITVPASEVIHDRCLTLFHPLLGVSPIYACGAAATQGIRIQANSAAFFENMSRPSGQLTSAGTIKEETAKRLKAEFEQNFSGGNLGRLLVTGDGLKYEPMTIPAADAQLIEQLKWTVEDVARCFRVPLHKIASGVNPTFNNVGAMNQDYYSQTLQAQIESIEVLLDEGLNLANVKEHEYGVEFDLDALLRMDPLGRAEFANKAIGAGYMAPNEARLKENLPPVTGGETPYMQQQNYSLGALAERDSESPLKAKPTVAPTPPTPDVAVDAPDPPTDAEDTPAKLALALIRRFRQAEMTT